MYIISILVLAASVASDVGEESILTTARLKTTDQGLLDFFQKRSPPFPPRSVIEQLAQTLADKDTDKADDAQGELVCLGAYVSPVVREVANQQDEHPQAAERAKRILQMIEGPESDRLPIETARLLAKRKPAGAVEVLLDYLPFADNDHVFEEVESALVAVGIHQNKADPIILAALKDSKAVRRGAAARVLCQAGGAAFWNRVRPLLKDPEPSVRLRVAQVLADADDSEAIPVLIDLLAETSRPVQTQAEEYLTRLAGKFSVSGPRGDEQVTRQLRRDIWAAWWQSLYGEKLLKAFQTRMLTDEQRNAKESDAPLPDVVFRLLRLRRPAGTVATLLAFLPCAANGEEIDRITETLSRVGMVDGKPDELLVKALQDSIGVRRSAAAVALYRGRAVDVLASVRKLLTDKNLEVRWRVARELALGGDREAVVVLSGLLGDLSSERAWEVEACLEKLAGDKAPSEITSEPIDWKKMASIWMKWWKDDRNKVVMVASDPSTTRVVHGYILVQPQSNAVTVLGRDGKPLWTLNGLRNPTDAQVLPDDHVLVAEAQDGCVTERDKRGKILWEKQGLPRPSSLQRLSNGNIFICSPGNELVEVDRKGKEVLRVQVPLNISWKSSARKLRDGRIILFTNNPQEVVQFDKTGRLVKRSLVPMTVNGFSAVLDNGHVIGAAGNTVIECDADGKEVHRFQVAQAVGDLFDACRLPNGHTLVLGNMQGQLKCVELDRTWKRVLKETMLPGPIDNNTRVRGR